MKPGLIHVLHAAPAAGAAQPSITSGERGIEADPQRRVPQVAPEAVRHVQTPDGNDGARIRRPPRNGADRPWEDTVAVCKEKRTRPQVPADSHETVFVGAGGVGEPEAGDEASVSAPVRLARAPSRLARVQLF